MKIYAKKMDGQYIGVLVYTNKNRTFNKWHGNAFYVDAFRRMTMRETALLEKGFVKVVAEDLKGDYDFRVACMKMIDHFYNELYGSSKKNLIKYFYAYIKGHLMVNIGKELGVKILAKDIEGLEHLVTYRMVGFRYNSRGQTEVKVENMYGQEQWLGLEDVTVNV